MGRRMVKPSIDKPILPLSNQYNAHSDQAAPCQVAVCADTISLAHTALACTLRILSVVRCEPQQKDINRKNLDRDRWINGTISSASSNYPTSSYTLLLVTFTSNST